MTRFNYNFAINLIAILFGILLTVDKEPFFCKSEWPSLVMFFSMKRAVQMNLTQIVGGGNDFSTHSNPNSETSVICSLEFSPAKRALG